MKLDVLDPREYRLEKSGGGGYILHGVKEEGKKAAKATSGASVVEGAEAAKTHRKRQREASLGKKSAKESEIGRAHV